MKKYIYVFGIAIILILLIKFICGKASIDINGQILFNLNSNGNNEITMYDCSKGDFDKITTNGLQAAFSENNTILLNRFNNICEYNLNNKEEIPVYQGESFDFFSICNDKNLSLSKDNYIYLFNKETKEKKVLVQDNNSKIHSWSKGRLVYSDRNCKIKSVDVLSGDIREICIGYDPIVCGTYVAYKNGDRLIVRNMQTNKEYKYNGSAYSYCFSPTGNELLIEDEISMGTFVKNFFNNGIVLGHSVIVWDYANNKRDTLIDSCVSVPNLICDWK